MTRYQSSHFISPGTEHDEDGCEVEYLMHLDMLELEEKDAEPGDLLMTQGEIYEVIGYAKEAGRIKGLKLVLHLCYEGA